MPWFAFQLIKTIILKKIIQHLTLKNVKVHLNAYYYADEDLNLDVSKNEYRKAFNMYTDGKTSYLNIGQNDYWASKVDFRYKYPLFIIDKSYIEKKT